jgi:thiamine pyrophosphate-dependent acetolactate synthase large subunit-like protein
MSAPPAIWTVARGADEDEVSELLERLAERLGMPTPQITNGSIMLPADYPRVARALDEVDSDWEELLVPPVA